MTTKPKAKIVFHKFITEGKASDLAHKLGLEYAGYGYWSKNGKIVAKTVNDNLVKTSATDQKHYDNKKNSYKPDMEANQSPWPSGPSAHDQDSMDAYEEEPQIETKSTASNILDKKTGNATGTNPGGFYLGKDEIYRYVKFYKDSGKTFGEVLANSLYEDTGTFAPTSEYFEAGDKNDVCHWGFASQIVPEVVEMKPLWDKLKPEGKKNLSDKILQGFAMDCLLANWDVVGVNEGFMRNIMVNKDGDPIRIDNGSAFLCRGLEGRKADIAAYGEEGLCKLTETEMFFKNPSYKEVLAAAGYKSAKEIPTLKKQIADILTLHNKSGGWQKYVESKVPDLQGKDKEQIIKMLYLRTKQLIDYVNKS